MTENFSLWILGTGFLVAAIGLLIQTRRIVTKPATRNQSRPKGSAQYGVFYAFTSGLFPWNKESGVLHPFVYALGVFFHIGIAGALVLLTLRIFFAPYRPSMQWLLYGLSMLSCIGAILGYVALARRFISSELRSLSNGDDILSVLLSALFMSIACLSSVGFLSLHYFDAVSALLFAAIPFTKIRHMLTFFISRFFLGKHMGTLGVFAPGNKVPFDREMEIGKWDRKKESENSQDKDSELAKEPVEIPEEKLPQLVKELDAALDRSDMAMLDACVHCAMCTESCHYYVSSGDSELIPVAKLDILSRSIRYERATGKLLSPLNGARQLKTREALALHHAAFENCCLCERCALSCPMGINTGQIMRKVRSAFFRTGATPPGLLAPARTAIEKGNYLGLPVDEVAENLEWIGEELADELGVEGLEIPLDKVGAEILVIPHPLELRDFPMMVMGMAKIFIKAGADFTFSRDHFDVVSYAYYGGDEESMKKTIEHLLVAQEKIGARKVVLSPCGHGYRVLRWEAERLVGRKFSFEILSFAELMDQFIQDGKLAIKKGAIEGPITFHDPCNLGRNGGVLDEPRRILRACSDDYVDMVPHGAWSFCCGGGGGLTATAHYGPTRMMSGWKKAQQIQGTQAKVVATNCFNCNTQIKVLDKRHELGVKVMSITEILADSLA